MNWTEAKYNYIREALGGKRQDEGDSYLPIFYALDKTEIPEYKHVGPKIGDVIRISEERDELDARYYAVIGSKFNKVISSFRKELEEIKEKEKMFVNNQVNEIKVTFNGRECNVLNAEIKHPGDPREMPTIELECAMTRSSIPYHEYAAKKKVMGEEFKKNMTIENVIFNPPATIVFWGDGTKTVVKAENEDFDPEKGLAMAITKKVLGNKGNYFETVKKWTKDAPKAEPLENRFKAAYNNGANDKWAEIEAKFKVLNEQLVVGNRITKKFFNAFNEAFAPTPKDDEV